MIKAIFIDIDGTLRDSDRNLPTKTIDTIKKVSEKGILVILCSRRPRKYTNDEIRALTEFQERFFESRIIS